MTWYFEHRFAQGKAKGKRLKAATRKRKDARDAKRLTGRKLTEREKRGRSHRGQKRRARVVSLDDLAVWKK